MAPYSGYGRQPLRGHLVQRHRTLAISVLCIIQDAWN